MFPFHPVHLSSSASPSIGSFRFNVVLFRPDKKEKHKANAFIYKVHIIVKWKTIYIQITYLCVYSNIRHRVDAHHRRYRIIIQCYSVQTRCCESGVSGSNGDEEKKWFLIYFDSFFPLSLFSLLACLVTMCMGKLSGTILRIIHTHTHTHYCLHV